jgi:hypothetical protein
LADCRELRETAIHSKAFLAERRAKRAMARVVLMYSRNTRRPVWLEPTERRSVKDKITMAMQVIIRSLV